MMHYHGTPITPRSEMHQLAGRNFCVSYADPRDVQLCHKIGQSVMLDNGAYTVWKQGGTVDWEAWAAWVEPWLECRTTWAVLPDSIDGGERENDRLMTEWGWMLSGKGMVVPVWHLHESLRRLQGVVASYGRVCFGSSAEYAVVNSIAWNRRVSEAFDAIADDDGRVPWVHMLRGMSMCGSRYPFASVDSTDIARNHARPHNNVLEMAQRWDRIQCPTRWARVDQLVLSSLLADEETATT